MVNNIANLTEQYILGNLSPTEIASFEQYLSKNPGAQAEVNMQQSITEGIKQKRRAELKANLAKVNPNTTTSLTTKLAVVAATLATATIVSIGLYTISLTDSSSDDLVETKKEILISKSADNKARINSKIDDSVKNIKSIETSNSESLENTKVTNIEKKTNTKATLGDVQNENTKTKIEDINSQTLYPDMTSFGLDKSDEQIIKGDQSVVTDGNHNSNVEISSPTLKIIKSKIQGYQYDGKEFILLGTYDYKKYPYKIYAPNTFNNNHNTVFEYKGEFYEMIESNKKEKWEDHILIK